MTEMGQGLERTTVILPTFNRSAFLVEALESLLTQTLPPAEILVMDDGSTDDTAERMASYASEIRYIRKTNSGKADTLNQGLRLARHPLIWIMDDDDLALPGALMAMTAAVNARPEIGFSYGRYQRFSVDEQGRRHVRDGGYWREVEDDAFLPVILEDFFVHHPGMLVRRSAYEDVGPFSTRYPRLEDYEMLIRLARRHACARIEDIVFQQRQHDGARVDGLAADDRTARWMQEGAEMFTLAHGELDLREYLSRSDRATPLSPAQQRQALIARAAVMARHKVWPLAFEDFRAATAVEHAQGPLSDAERITVRGALFSKFGSPEVIGDPNISQGLRTLSREGPVGRSITRSFARALIWFIRTQAQAGRLAEAARYARLAVTLASS